MGCFCACAYLGWQMRSPQPIRCALFPDIFLSIVKLRNLGLLLVNLQHSTVHFAADNIIKPNQFCSSSHNADQQGARTGRDVARNEFRLYFQRLSLPHVCPTCSTGHHRPHSRVNLGVASPCKDRCPHCAQFVFSYCDI